MINLAKHKLHIGFYLQKKVRDKERNKVGIKASPIPDHEETLTRSTTNGIEEYTESDAIPFVSCKDLFFDVEELSEAQRSMVENGSSIDPKMATVENNKVYSEIYSRFVVQLSEELTSN